MVTSCSQPVCPDLVKAGQKAIRRMYRSLIVTSLLVFSLSVESWAQVPPKLVGQLPKSVLGKGNWEFLETKKGIRLSRKLVGKSGLFAVRGEAVVKSPIGKVATVIHDETRWTEWTNVMGAKLVKLHSDNRKTVYQSFDMPMVVSDRDVVYTYGVWEMGETIFISGKSGSVKGNIQTIGVRMNLLAGDWYLTPTAKGHTRVVLEVLMDPKGYLPVWFVNVVQRDYPLNTLLGLQKQSAKAGVTSFPRTSMTKLTPAQR
jgi:hypothetical protein